MPFCGRIDETIPNCLIVLVAASLTEMEQTVDEQLVFWRRRSASLDMTLSTWCVRVLLILNQTQKQSLLQEWDARSSTL